MSGSLSSRLKAILGNAWASEADSFFAQMQAEQSLLYTTIASVATGSGTAEQTLATYSLPANTLSATDRVLRITASFSAAADGNNKTFKLYFGSEVITSGVLTTNNKNGNAELLVVRTGASTQIVSGKMLVDTTNVTPYVATGAETDTAAITIKFTATDGTNSAGEITLNHMMVELLH